jgi:lysophospholipase L1-like esterase
MLKPILTLLTTLLLTPLGLLLAADAPKSSKAETFVTPKRDRAGMNSDVPIDKALPNVLILGDSISIGYTRQVREGLKGKANVIRPNANCGDTRHGLAQIETWLGDGKWQVIHFNWGLHDLCYRNPELKTPGQRDKVNGTLSVPLTEYEKNLETLVERLKQTGAKLIFANTTLVPEGEAGRFPGDEVKYNAAAQRVMEKHGVPINDLHATTQAFPPAMFAGPGNVHFSAEGSAKLAGQVVAHVAQALPIPAKAAPAKTALFIGDAVGAQYAETLRDLLKARITVHFLAAPAGGKAEVDAFLAQLPALLAQHDLVLYAGVLEAARVDPDTGKPALSMAQFRQFLDGLGKSGQDRQTKWIWATSVPVPVGTAAISAAQIEANNRTLTDNAYKRRAMLLDLHEYVRIRREDMQLPGDFLLTDAGVSLIGSVVANKMEEVLMEGNEPDLPNLLVLGDSIVGQYSTFLRSAMLHKANVRTGATAFDHQPDWAEIVRQQVTEPEQELGRPFDLIQFNWGQHALKWMQGKEYSREPKEGYTRCIPLERYGAELEKLVMELKKTGRPLMWATTTPANNESKPDDAEAYNAVALQVMHKHQIPVNDLYRFARNSQLPMQGCHFPREASEQLGNQVAGQLFDAVAKDQADPSPAKPSR